MTSYSLLSTFKSSRIIALSFTLFGTALLAKNSLASQTNAALNEQVKKQLAAMQAQQNLPKLTLTKIHQAKTFTLWNSTANQSPTWGASLEQAAQLFESVVGLPQAIDIVLVDKPADVARVDTSAFNYPLVLPINAVRSKKVSEASVIDGVIRHESCHQWLISYANSKGLKSIPNANGMPSYGHPQLPDWLDETVAVMCENSELKGSRLKDSHFESIDMKSYLTMEHPVYAQIKTMLQAQKQAQGVKSENQTMVLTLEDNEQDKLNYYTQSAYFKQFLVAKFGIKSLGMIVDDFIDGKTIEQSLASRFNVASIKALEREFEKFVLESK